MLKYTVCSVSMKHVGENKDQYEKSDDENASSLYTGAKLEHFPGGTLCSESRPSPDGSSNSVLMAQEPL
jgi:hypothetical protein